MSDDTIAATADPFSSTALDEETELRALQQALQFSEGFKLIFVRCNQPEHRKRLVEILRTRLPEQNISEVHLTEPVTHLLDALRERLPSSAPDALLVSGLEYSLPVAAEAPTTPFIANLNASRNSFPEVIPYPLVLWIPEYVLNAIILAAPDFFSIRSGVYFFAATPGETMEVADSLTSGAEFTLYDLTHAEKLERIRAIENLLADYEALPADQRDLYAEMRLHLRVGNLLAMLASYDAAESHYQQILTLANELSDRPYKAAALISIGVIYLDKRRFPEAEEAFQKSIEMFYESNNHEYVAYALANLGNLYAALRRWDDAKKAYEQSVEIRHKLGKTVEEGLSLYHLALVLTEQGQLPEAEEVYKQSFDIAREHDIYSLLGANLHGLGFLYKKQGRRSEADRAYQQALNIFRQLDNRKIVPKILHNLALLRIDQGDIESAIDFVKQAVEILKAVGDKQNLAKEHALLETLEKEAKEGHKLSIKQ
ncbi:MAG TPA: tetratricopeptide repeat protein [Pyrinomonadaceae bacterium]|jgi:tetratricopeptide (TPR) repeat protein